MTKVVYEARSLDIAMAAGGPMGSSVITNWTRLFATLSAAKLYCEKDYKNAIEWQTASKRTQWSSGDLLHVMYEIEKTIIHH